MDSMSNTSLRIAFVICFLLLIITFITLNKSNMVLKEKNLELQQVQLQKDSLQKVCDSLYNENYPCQIELSRFQIAYKIFLERNPKAASQYGDIISEETE